jgi:hypothetical protein
VSAQEDDQHSSWFATFPTIDLAAVMRKGVSVPDRICGGHLYPASLHSVAGEPESGKTTLAGDWTRQMLSDCNPVLWLDEESGRDALADKLLSLGTEADDVECGLYYLEFPGLRWTDHDVTALRDMLDKVQPALIVFDSSAGFMSAAGLGENDNDGAGNFYKRVLLRAARHSGAAVVVLDHTRKDGEGGRYARGAGAKLGYVDVAYSLERIRPFTRQDSGALRLIVRKDRRGYLHRQHDIAVHVEEGNVRLDITDATAQTADELGGPAARKLLEAVQASDMPLTITALVDAVHAKHGHGLRRETASRELNKLLNIGLVDCLDDGLRREKRWFATRPSERCDDL